MSDPAKTPQDRTRDAAAERRALRAAAGAQATYLLTIRT